MSDAPGDEGQRELERRRRAMGAPAEGARWLTARARAGHLDADALRWAHGSAAPAALVRRVHEPATA